MQDNRAQRHTERVQGISLRAVLIGLLCIALMALVNPWLQFGLQSWWIVGVGSLLAGPVMVLFLLVCVNSLLARWFPRRTLTRTELLVIYGMGLSSLGFLGHGGLPYMVSYVTYPFYMATPANGWDHSILPYFPTWLTPASREAAYWFWEGLPDGAGVPWGAIAQPMAAWSVFTFLLLAAMYCLGALFTKDWVEEQRLTFPLVEVPLALTGETERPTIVTSLLSNRFFWLGFAVPAVLGVFGFLHRFFPDIPQSSLSNIHLGKPYLGMSLPWKVLGEMYFSIEWDILGVMCLIPTEVSLSIWLFYLLYYLQLLVWAIFGIAEGSSQSSIQPISLAAFEETGAYIALAGILLWESRRALKRAFISIIGHSSQLDPYEPLSGRALTVGFMLANIGLFWLGIRAGVSAWTLAVLLGLFYCIGIGASRLVTAGGIMFISFKSPRSTIFRLLDGRSFNVPSTIFTTMISGIYMDDPYNLAMPHMMNSFRLVRSEKINGRIFTWVALLATLIVLGVGVPAMLKMIYQQGATKLGDWPFSMWPRGGYQQIESSLRVPERAAPMLQVAVLIGAFFMLGLSWLHLHLVSWPVSPIGFLIASQWATNHILWGSALLGWILVVNIKRWGGLQLYRKLRPVFLGLIIGSYLSGALFGLITSIVMYRRLS